MLSSRRRIVRRVGLAKRRFGARYGACGMISWQVIVAKPWLSPRPETLYDTMVCIVIVRFAAQASGAFHVSGASIEGGFA